MPGSHSPLHKPISKCPAHSQHQEAGGTTSTTVGEVAGNDDASTCAHALTRSPHTNMHSHAHARTLPTHTCAHTRVHYIRHSPHKHAHHTHVHTHYTHVHSRTCMFTTNVHSPIHVHVSTAHMCAFTPNIPAHVYHTHT